MNVSILLSLLFLSTAWAWEDLQTLPRVQDRSVVVNYFQPWSTGQTVTVSRDWIGRALLRTKSCDELPKYFEQITLYALQQGTTQASPVLESRPIGLTEGCEVEITSLLPQSLRDGLWNMPKYESTANCWGTTMALTKNNEAIRMMGEGTYFKHFTDLTCHRIDYSEVGPNDVLVIRVAKKGQYKEEAHGAYALSKDLFITKNGVSEENSVVVSTLSEILKIYFNKASPFKDPVYDGAECFNVGDTIPETCRNYALFMRCGVYKDQALNSAAIRPEYKELYQQAAEIEMSIGKQEYSELSYSWPVDFAEVDGEMIELPAGTDAVAIESISKERTRLYDQTIGADDFDQFQIGLRARRKKMHLLGENVSKTLKEATDLTPEEKDFLKFLLNKF